MSILTQTNLIPQAIISNGLVTGNTVQTPDNLLNTTDSTAIFGATSDVIVGNFPFNIPLDAVIVGISGIIKARIDNNSIPAGSLTPALVDASSGSNLYFPGTPVVGLSNVLQEYVIGGSYDVWGNVSWTPTKINNLKLQMTANSALEVAWASLTVYYYIPQVTPVPPPFSLPGCADCDSEIQALPFELIQPWLAGQTILRVKNFWTPDGTFIDLAMIGTCGGTINLTVDPDLRKEDGGNFIENFNIDSSLATITQFPGYTEIDLGNISQRGLGFSTPYGTDAANISEHAVGAVVIITNNGPYNSKLLKRCHIGTIVSAPITVEDEGNTVTVATDIFNFRGPNAQATQDPIDPFKANIDIIANPSNVLPTPGSNSTGTNGTTPSLTLTIPHTIILGENYLRVWVSTQDIAIASVTFNAVPMTLVANETNGGFDVQGALYELINPAVGLHNIVITMAAPAIISGGGDGFSDVDTTNPTDSISTGNSGTDDAPTDSITTLVQNVFVQDVVATKTNPTTFTQFGLWSILGQINASDRPGASSGRSALAVQTLTDQYGLNTSMDWVIVLAGIRGIASPAGGVQTVTGTYIDNTDPANPVSVVPLNNTAAVNPTVNDDNTLGYLIDSKWFNSVSGILWTCEDATTGAAVWTAVTAPSVQNNPTAVVAPTVNDDSGTGYSIGSYWFDTVTSTLYIAQSVGVGAAVWDAVGGSSTDELVAVSATDTTPDFLQPKLNVHSSDGSVVVNQTITNPAGNEILDIDLSATGIPSVLSVSSIDDFVNVIQVPDNGSSSDNCGLSGNFQIVRLATSTFDPATITSEVNHPGIFALTADDTWFFGFSVNQNPGATPSAGLISLANDFDVTYLMRFVYAAQTFEIDLGLDDGGATDIRFNILNGVISYVPGSGAPVATVIPVPATGTWFQVRIQYVAGILTMTFNGTQAFSGAVALTGFGWVFGNLIQNAGMTSYDTDYVITNYTVTR